MQVWRAVNGPGIFSKKLDEFLKCVIILNMKRFFIYIVLSIFFFTVSLPAKELNNQFVFGSFGGGLPGSAIESSIELIEKDGDEANNDDVKTKTKKNKKDNHSKAVATGLIIGTVVVVGVVVGTIIVVNTCENSISSACSNVDCSGVDFGLDNCASDSCQSMDCNSSSSSCGKIFIGTASLASAFGLMPLFIP